MLFSFTGLFISSHVGTFAILIIIVSYFPLFLGDFLLVPSAEAIINQFSTQEMKRKLMGMLYLSMAFARLGGAILCGHLMNKENAMTIVPYQEALLTLDTYVLIAILLITIVLSVWRKRET